MQESNKYVRQLRNWYVSPAGKVLSNELQHKLAQLLPELFGYYALQVGTVADEMDLLHSSAISQKIYMAMGASQCDVIASPLALPFPQDTLDLIVLPHTLDFSQQPHQVLREVHRVLIPDGHIVVIGFNPVSMMGLSKLALFRSRRAPWTGHFYTARRLKDWFSLLGFVVVKAEHVGLCLPIQNLRLQRHLGFLKKADHYRIGNLGGVQLFIARKRVLTLTPKLQPRRSQRRIFPLNVVEPSTRQANRVGTSQHLH